MRFCRPPPPRPRLRQGYPCTSAGIPHPARACGAPPPPPEGGVGSAWRYQGSSRIRGGAGGKSYLGWSWWETVSGVEPAGNRIRGGAGGKPYPGWSRWETVPGFSPGSPHVLDRGDIATGGGADGEGELVPPPLSPTLQPSNFSLASLARAFLPVKHTLSAGSPAPPAPAAGGYPYALCRQPPPAPISLPGRQGDIRWATVWPAPSPALASHLTVAAVAIEAGRVRSRTTILF